MISASVLVFAAAAGSALGAVVVRPLTFAYRTPSGEAARRSCPACGHTVLRIRAAELTALCLARRCSGCGHSLGPARFLPEALTGAGVAAVVAGGSEPWVLAAQLWLVVIGAVLILVDTAVHRLPDHLTAAAAVGIALLLGAGAATGHTGNLERAALAATVVATVFLPLVLAGGMGLGDLKLAPTLAAVLGWHGWATLFYGIGAGFVIGALQAIVLIAARKADRRGYIAFGPALIIGTLAISAGPAII